MSHLTNWGKYSRPRGMKDMPQWNSVDAKCCWYEQLMITGRDAPSSDAAKELLGVRAVMLGTPAPMVWSNSLKLRVPNSYHDFSEKLIESGFKLFEVTASSSPEVPESATFFSESGFIYCGRTTFPGQRDSKGVYVNMVTCSRKESDEVMELFNLHFEKKPSCGQVFMMVSTKEGPEFNSVGSGGLKLCRDNYSPEVLESYDRITQELLSDTPRGRLTIIEGPAGSGKSTMIRGMLDELHDALFVVVPSHLAGSLGDPTMLSAMGKLQSEYGGSRVVVIIEDADECLESRSAGNMSTIAAILNLSDGILGVVLDIRILATTNAKEHDLDDAIKRPGRLNTILHIGALDVEKANQVYQRLMPGGPEVFKKPATLAEIYQKAYDAGWKGVSAPATKKVGFS
jgi:hypothetical protein